MIDTKITSATSRRISLSIILIVAASSVIACNSISGMGDTGNGGAVDTPDSDTSEPSDPQAGDQPVLSDDAVPDFSVLDVNVESARYAEAVSPRDYLGRISAWYFGHAT